LKPEKVQLEEGRQRWWHGPIDLIIQAEGEAEVIQAAHARAWAEFQSVLTTLVPELPILRQAVQPGGPNPCHGAIARAMWQACEPLAGPEDDDFITPMAAVAGAVAQQLLKHYQLPGVWRASINNGGDIALHLSAGQQWRLGVVSDIRRPGADECADGVALPDGWFTVQAADPTRGVATSGWDGRSFSRGIADSVTVLAATAAQADAAATLIANRVNIDHSGIVRAPACQVRDDHDLGARLVTRHVPVLDLGQIMTALQRGLAYAQDLQRRGLIHAALLICQRQFVSCGHPLCLQQDRIGVTST
jgi:ApbE superfamily uncharacterized protein (UPF0280 family)